MSESEPVIVVSATSSEVCAIAKTTGVVALFALGALSVPLFYATLLHAATPSFGVIALMLGGAAVFASGENREGFCVFAVWSGLGFLTSLFFRVPHDGIPHSFLLNTVFEDTVLSGLGLGFVVVIMLIAAVESTKWVSKTLPGLAGVPRWGVAAIHARMLAGCRADAALNPDADVG